MRAGSQTLTLLASPRTFLILRALAEGRKDRLELRRKAGSPAQTTLRSQLGSLEEQGITAKHRSGSLPVAHEYALTDSGRELLTVAAGLQRWLDEAPQGELEPSNAPGRVAIKGLVESWNTTVLTKLAAGPLSLTELDKRITITSYPAIERCLETMRLAEQVEVGARGSSGTPYAPTAWLRRGMSPLTLAARWEHRNKPDGAEPVTRDDLEWAIAVIAPLCDPPATSGLCQVAVRASSRARRRRSLAALEASEDGVAFGAVDPERKPDARASGSADTWFSLLIDAESRGLRLSGDQDLAHAIFDSLREALFEGEPEGAELVDTQPDQGW